MKLSRKKPISAVLASLLLAAPASAGKQDSSSIDSIARSTIRFLDEVQVDKHEGHIYVPGEWKAQVYAQPISEALGIGETKGNEEPSAFTTGSIMNQLALIHKDHPELSQIPRLIDKANRSLDRYQDEGLYNFYPPKLVNGVPVHGTASMRLTAIWQGFTNVPADSDTTSVAYTARHFASELKGEKPAPVPSSVYRSLSRYRDAGRDAHWYNEKMGMIKTGAFLTWHMDENDPRNSQRQFADAEYGKRIPFETNDVDCIVNLNTLRMLAVTGRSKATKGRDESCALMNYVIESENYAKCGIYYPNTYNFAYSAAQVDKAGEKCLSHRAPKMLNFILRNQDANGSWANKDNYEVEDRVQATAYAMHALAHFGDRKDKRVRAALEKGTRFLKSRMKRTKGGLTYWPGETFFTATAIARSVIDWKSDAYTTTTALGALLEADKFLNGENKAKAPAAPLPPKRPADLEEIAPPAPPEAESAPAL